MYFYNSLGKSLERYFFNIQTFILPSMCSNSGIVMQVSYKRLRVLEAKTNSEICKTRLYLPPPFVEMDKFLSLSFISLPIAK